MPPAAARPAALTRGPFLGSRAIKAGLLTRAQLRSSAWQRLMRDVYLDARVTVDHRIRTGGAALLLPPGAVITGRSAAHLYGATLAGPDDPVEVATPVRFGPVQGIQASRRRLRSAELRSYQGIPVTTPLATGYQLARTLDLEDAVVWLDALGRARGLSRRDLVAHVGNQRGEPGWRRAGRAAELCDPRAESPPESRVRLWLTVAGLPTPVPQFMVVHEGEFIARVDLAWPQWKFAIEYDGQWHAGPGQLARDRRRIRQLNALGWYVYPVTSADLHAPATLIASIGDLLARRRAP